jgi:uncharacterized Fe-S center protein
VTNTVTAYSRGKSLRQRVLLKIQTSVSGVDCGYFIRLAIAVMVVAVVRIHQQTAVAGSLTIFSVGGG